MTHDDDLRRLLATARADAAARSRAGIGALRDLVGEDATLPGILVDLADDGRSVRLAIGGEAVVGTVARVSTGGVHLIGPASEALVRLGAIDAIETVGRSRLDGDGRTIPSGSWAALLDEVVERGDDVRIGTGATHRRGTVVSIGPDVVVLDATDGSTTYARTDAIDVVIVASSAAARRTDPSH